MKIELSRIKIRDVFEGYKDSQEEGVVAYKGKLDIRPKYQREFVYKDNQRNAVIDTIRKNFPLNVMYWVKNNGHYEVLDGQQRTLSFCQYINGDFSINYQYFHNLESDEKEQILDYELMIYICEGTDSEKLDWFKIINIAGEKLTNQELRNAVYSGEWLTEAKKHFSKISCPAYQIGSKYIAKRVNRQEFLEIALSWIADKENIPIEGYMSKHQHDNNANELWLYYQNVINWVQVIFPKYRKEQKGVEWGLYYNLYKNINFDTKELEKQVTELMKNDDVTKKSGIYEYLLDGNEKHLSIRTFTDSMKREAYEKQGGICSSCGKQFDIEEMEADHIDPWSIGGKTTANNCQMLCKSCNRRKSNK